MESDGLQNLLNTCSLCLRVRLGSDWIEAEEVIRELRSYDFPVPPRMRPALCEACSRSILERRSAAEDRLAA